MSSRFTTISLVLNVALVGLVAWLWSNSKRELAEANRTHPEPIFVTNTVKQIAVRKVGSSNFWAALAANRAPNWGLLESSNYVSYIENLRSIGCPEETIRDIIIADVAKTYAKKRAEVRAQAPAHFPYWKSHGAWRSSPEGQALQQQFLSLEEEERALVKQLLGVDLDSEAAKFTRNYEPEAYNYSFLPEEKRQKVLELEEQFDELGKAIHHQAKGIVLNEDKEQYRKLKKQKEEELAKILTPEELEDYQVRNSPTASHLLGQLDGFDVSEEEFRKIFRVQKTFEDQFSDAFNATDPKQMEIQEKARDEAQQALNEELKKDLGNQRFAEYQRAQDSDYRSLVQLTERFEVPRDTAAKVYDMKQEAERQKRAVEANPNLTPARREAALAALAKETQRAMSQTLGGNDSKIWKAYQQTGARQWIDNLSASETLVTPEPEPVETTPAMMPNLPPFPPFPPMPMVPTK